MIQNTKFEKIHKAVMKEYGEDVVIIEYPMRWGGQFKDKTFWMATINGDVEDYHLPEILIEDAEKHNRKWVMLKHHKNGTSSVFRHSHNTKIKKGGKTNG